MPLNDRVSPPPLRSPEQRPFHPVGVLRFTHAGKKAVEWICEAGDLDPPEWVKIGCLRLGQTEKLTDWAWC
eukprot:1029305-Amphidinium_carterae.1